MDCQVKLHLHRLYCSFNKIQFVGGCYSDVAREESWLNLTVKLGQNLDTAAIMQVDIITVKGYIDSGQRGQSFVFEESSGQEESLRTLASCSRVIDQASIVEIVNN